MNLDEFDDSSGRVLKERLEAEKQIALAQPKPTLFPAGPANFKVKAGNYQWNFHKENVVAKSEYFAMMISSQFAVSVVLSRLRAAAADTRKEANGCFVDLSNDEPELLARMFIWCYCGKYSVGTGVQAVDGAKSVDEVFQEGWQGDAKGFKEPEYTGAATHLHLKMLVLADYYMMPELEAYCLRKLERALWEDDKEYMSCVGGLDEIELLDETVNKVLECMLRQSRNNYFSEEQKAKIRDAGQRFPALRNVRFLGMLEGAVGYW